MKWRMEEMCDNCPFAHEGAGKQLRDSLRHGRWPEILHSLVDGKMFPCHKTVNYEEDSEGKIDKGTRACAGAIQWQQRNSLDPQYIQVLSRMSAMHQSGKTLTRRKTRG